MKRCLIVVVLFFATLAGQAHAQFVGSTVRMQFPDGVPPLDETAVVVDPGVEFNLYNQLTIDLTENMVTLQPLIDATFITYDAILTVQTPGVEFTGVTPLNIPPNYSVSFDAGLKAIVIHHNQAQSGPNDVLTAQFTTSVTAVPEPGAYAMLGGLAVSGLLVMRRRRKAV
jgi:hypothetical protein